ncbi:unnamed protein product, partial [Ectocarpus sp. 12 AP-2014]
MSPADHVRSPRTSVGRVGNKITGMFSTVKALLTASQRSARELAERQKLESESESSYKSTITVWSVIFMALVLGMALAMAMLM